MSIQTLLDDAAAEATAGLRVDLAAAQRQADRHRVQVRHRASAMMAAAVAVAAVSALIAVLLPGRLFGAFAPPAASITDAPTGLPDHWYYAPPWAPPVTRNPMAAASMVLAAYDGPVLVSADGKIYASLPWSRWDGEVALSPDGRNVAWVTQRDDRGGPNPAVVHRIRLSDGVQKDVSLPKREVVQRMAWNGDRLLISVVSPGQGLSLHTLAAGSDTLQSGGVLPSVLTGSTQAMSEDAVYSDGVVSAFNGEDFGNGRHASVTRKEVDGAAVPSTLTIIRPGVKPVEVEITGEQPIFNVRILGWADGGIVMRVHGRDPEYGNPRISLRIYALDGTYRIVSRRVETQTFPVAVAADVVGDGQTVPGVRPQFPTTDRAHVRFLVARAWNVYGFWITVGGFVLAGVIVQLVWWRYRRRRRNRQDAGHA